MSEQPKAYDPSQAEMAVIGACLVNPERISEVAAKLQPDDFQDKLHSLTFGILVRQTEAGRKPSLETVLAEIGNDELEPNLTPRKYFTEVIRSAVVGQFLPVQDGVGVVLEASQRRTLSSIGWQLASGSADRVADLKLLATQTVESLDGVLASMRPKARRQYDGFGAADLAIAHMRSPDRRDPTTGLSDLDQILGGWPRGQLSIVAARPGMGKSAMATSAVYRAAKAGYGCAFFSLEMTGEQLGARLLTDIAYTRDMPVYYENILKRNVTERDERRIEVAQQQLAGLPMLIEEQRDLSIAEIAVRCRKMAREFEKNGKTLDVVFVDHMLLVQPSQRYAGNRVREVAEISGGLATMAKEMGVAVVALCQLNRGVEGRDNKRPDLADLRDSGSIEEDASTVTFLFRPAYYLEKTKHDDPDMESLRLGQLEQSRNVLDFVVAKNRNGRVGVLSAFVDIGANAVRNGAYGR
jgi:replicative DNA helicase